VLIREIRGKLLLLSQDKSFFVNRRVLRAFVVQGFAFNYPLPTNH
jgi:hypothetical protein